MEKNFGFGIIGCGIGDHHAKCIDSLEEASLVAVADLSEERGKRLAEEHNAEYYRDYQKMLQREDIDIIDVCTPSGMHGEHTIAAAKAGKHVICEKPIEVDLKKADLMIKTCEENKVKLAVIFQHRFRQSSFRLKNAILKGKLGRLVLADAYVKWYRAQNYYDETNWRGTLSLDGGACLINQSVHSIDLLQWMMGPVETVFGSTTTLTHRIEGEDVATALLRFKSGALGVIEGSTSCYPGFPERLEIYGDKGGVIISGDKISAWKLSEKEEEEEEEVGVKEMGSGASDPMAIGLGGHTAQIQDMINAIKEDKSPLVDGKEGRKALEIILAIYASAREKKIIHLPL